MICPRCGAYSPYNTAVCNRCGTKLLGKNAGKSPRRSRSQQFYRRTRQSDWEKNRDQLLAKANDTLDGIMADREKRKLLIVAVIAAAAVLAGSVIGCVSCSCGGCDGCTQSAVPAVSQSDTGETAQTGTGSSGGLLHNLLGDSESGEDAAGPGDVSGSDLQLEG